MDAITAKYVQEDADWAITVEGLGRKLTARAPGIIAARDRADQLVEKVAPEQNGRTVVHLLNGSALDFTATYMQARLTRPTQQTGAADLDAVAAKGAEKKTDTKKPAAPKARRPRTAAKRSTKPGSTNGKKADPRPAEPPADVGAALDTAEAK